jgi:hypothetical protein
MLEVQIQTISVLQQQHRSPESLMKKDRLP